MEKSLDRILAGQNGVITYDKDRNGNIVPGSDKVSVKTEDGKRCLYDHFSRITNLP